MFPADHKCGAGLNAKSITGGIHAEWSVGTEQFDDTTDGCEGIRQRVVSKTLTAPWRLDRLRRHGAACDHHFEPEGRLGRACYAYNRSFGELSLLTS
jgi:hypothetical protein